MVHKEEVISTAEWLVRRERHRREILPITEPFRARRTAGKADPGYDFLFTYYNFSTNGGTLEPVFRSGSIVRPRTPRHLLSLLRVPVIILTANISHLT